MGSVALHENSKHAGHQSTAGSVTGPVAFRVVPPLRSVSIPARFSTSIEDANHAQRMNRALRAPVTDTRQRACRVPVDDDTFALSVIQELILLVLWAAADALQEDVLALDNVRQTFAVDVGEYGQPPEAAPVCQPFVHGIH